MSTKTTIISIVAVVLLAGIAYLVYAYTMKPKQQESADQSQQQQQQNQQATSTSTPEVQGQEVKVGTGAEAVPGARVYVEYVGQLTNGTVFDSSQNQGKPLDFVLGDPGIIPGFQIGVRGMRVGGERIIAIPPELAYGNQQVGTIPPNSTLIFQLRLVKVDPPAKTPANQ